MEQTREGWIATLYMTPENLRTFGVAPTDAVALLLARAEIEFSEARSSGRGIRPRPMGSRVDANLGHGAGSK
jgi:hypothetical protein